MLTAVSAASVVSMLEVDGGECEEGRDCRVAVAGCGSETELSDAALVFPLSQYYCAPHCSALCWSSVYGAESL